MDVLFINSSNMQYREIFRGSNSLPPLGLLYMAAVLKQQRGYTCELIDFVVQDKSRADLRAKVAGRDRLLVGISTYADSYGQVAEVAKFIKLANPSAKIVVGGAFPTFTWKEILAEQPSIDYVVRGEGEETVVELADHVLASGNGRDPGHIKGIAYRRGCEPVISEPRPVIGDLDAIPFPDRTLVKELIDGQQYSLPFSIHTSRGCPGDCIFCSSRSFWGSKVRFRSAGNVFSELRHLMDNYDVYTYHIVDDTFTVRKSLVFEFCRLVREAGISVRWSCESRADAATPELLKTLWDAGCRAIQFGIESGNQDILTALKKKVTLEQIENAARMAHHQGFKVIGSFILGHYVDTLDTMRQTIAFGRKLKEKYRVSLAFALNTPFPGTYQRDHADELGMTIHTKDYSDLVLCKPHISTRNFTCEDLQNMFFEATDSLT